MKNILSAATLTFVGTFFLTACPATPPSGTTPSASPSTSVSPSPGTNASANVHLSSKAAFIKYLECAKSKKPQVAAVIDAQIAIVNGVSDANWAVSSAGYATVYQAYVGLGCN